MRVPNSFVTRFTNPSELKLACVFCSLIHKNTKKNLLGYEIVVKQETLARLCNYSLATVKRSITALRNKGLIVSQQRTTSVKADMGILSTYRYVIQVVPTNFSYFNIERVLMQKVNGQAFRVYVAFCKLASKKENNSFYQSYNDICQLLGMDRRSVINAVAKLKDKYKLIGKKTKINKCGDYTDNTYYVFAYVKNKHIKKKSSALHHKCRRNERLTTYVNRNKSIYSLYSNDKTLSIRFAKKIKVFLLRGGG